MFYRKKGGSFWTEKSVFYCEKLKSQCFAAKRGHFKTGEQGWEPLLAVIEGAGTCIYILSTEYSATQGDTNNLLC